jgi:hypothetical protein
MTSQTRVSHVTRADPPLPPPTGASAVAVDAAFELRVPPLQHLEFFGLR